jgi:hypothetical protein
MQIARATRVFVSTAVLVAGLVYSVLALSINAPIARATSCDCTEAAQDAIEYCQHYSPNEWPQLFTCPTGSGQDHFNFNCVGDRGSYGPFSLPCSL